MQLRQLGSSNLEVSAFGLGCMGMTGVYNSAGGRQEMISLLRAAVDRGPAAPLRSWEQEASRRKMDGRWGMNRAMVLLETLYSVKTVAAVAECRGRVSVAVAELITDVPHFLD